MSVIPTGCFLMGDPFSEGNVHERPVHNVCITSDFSMDVHETTNAEYKACVDTGVCTAPGSSASSTRGSYYGNPIYDDFPVIFIDWSQGSAYCSWAGKRLPSEAQWEYASRGDLSGKRYAWGDTITGADANYWDSGDIWDNNTSPVENYAANGYGLYDMSGNSYEWISDWYLSTYYNTSPTNDPPGPPPASERILRGGCFNGTTDCVRVAYRDKIDPTGQYSSIGVRCARD